MATANKSVGLRYVTKKVLEEVPAGVTLKLDHDEARVLAIILAGVGGAGLRNIATEIYQALKEAGYDSWEIMGGGMACRLFEQNSRGMYFTADSRLPE